MVESSTTTLPGASIYKPHVESGIEPMSIEDEARRANEEAARQSTNTKKVK